MIETETIKNAQNGDKHAFEQIVQQYQKMVFACAYHHLNRLEDAQDVAQDVFVNAWENLSSLQDLNKLSGWLRGITANLCKRQWRNRKRIFISYDSDTDLQLITDDPTPEEMQETKDTHQSVNALLKTLSETNRLVLTLHHLDNLSDEEIGHMLDLSTKAVRVRRHRAIKQLQSETINMIKENLTANPLDNEFTEKVMKRVGLFSIGLGDQNGQLWFETQDKQHFVISTTHKNAEAVVANPKPNIKNHQKSAAIVTAPEDLEFLDQLPDMAISENSIYDFTDQLINAFDLKLQHILLDSDNNHLQASTLITQGKKSTTLPLNVCDAVMLAGRTKTPLYATKHVLDKMTFGDAGVSAAPKEKIIQAQQKPKVDWEHLLNQALSHNAHHVQIAPTKNTAEVVYQPTDASQHTETISIDIYKEQLNFLNRHLDPETNALYIRCKPGTFELIFDISEPEQGKKPTISMTIQPYENPK